MTNFVFFVQSLIMTKFFDFKLKRAYKSIVTDIKSNDTGNKNNIFIKPIPPRIIMDTIRMQLDRNALKKP